MKVSSRSKRKLFQWDNLTRGSLTDTMAPSSVSSTEYDSQEERNMPDEKGIRFALDVDLPNDPERDQIMKTTSRRRRHITSMKEQIDAYDDLLSDYRASTTRNDEVKRSIDDFTVRLEEEEAKSVIFEKKIFSLKDEVEKQQREYELRISSFRRRVKRQKDSIMRNHKQFTKKEIKHDDNIKALEDVKEKSQSLEQVVRKLKDQIGSVSRVDDKINDTVAELEDQIAEIKSQLSQARNREYQYMNRIKQHEMNSSRQSKIKAAPRSIIKEDSQRFLDENYSKRTELSRHESQCDYDKSQTSSEDHSLNTIDSETQKNRLDEPDRYTIIHLDTNVEVDNEKKFHTSYISKPSSDYDEILRRRSLPEDYDVDDTIKKQQHKKCNRPSSLINRIRRRVFRTHNSSPE